MLKLNFHCGGVGGGRRFGELSHEVGALLQTLRGLQRITLETFSRFRLPPQDTALSPSPCTEHFTRHRKPVPGLGISSLWNDEKQISIIYKLLNL